MNSRPAFSGKLPPARIQLFIHDLSGGGSERQLACLANGLAEEPQFEAIQVVTIGAIGHDKYPLHPRIERHGLGLSTSQGGLLRGLISNRRRIRGIQQIAKTWKPDCVISFCDTVNILVLQALAGRVPILISERSDPRKKKLSPVWEWMRDRSYPKASVCVAQSEEVSEYLRKRHFQVTPDRVVTIPSAIEAPAWQLEELKQLRRGMNCKICLYVGRLAEEKRVDRLLDAWGKIAKHHPDWRLRLVGDGPLRSDLEAQARRLDIAPTIQWRPWTSNIWDEWREGSLFVLTSDFEGLPQSLLEGMSAGLPIVVSDCSPAIREVFSKGDIGTLVPMEDDFALSLDRAMADESRRVEQSRNAFTLSQQYHWKAIAPQWYKQISKLEP